MIKTNLDKTDVLIEGQALLNMFQMVKDIDLKVVNIFKKMLKLPNNLSKFAHSLVETMSKSILLSQPGFETKEIGRQFSEKLKMHSDEISEMKILISDINQLKKDILSKIKKTEEMKKETIFLPEEVDSEIIINMTDKNVQPFLFKTLDILSAKQKEITKIYDMTINVVNQIERWKTETSNNNPVQPTDLLLEKENDLSSVFVGTIAGGQAIIEGNGKFCIMGTGPGFSWERGKEIKFEQNTGEWTLPLGQCNQEFKYKFAVVFPEWIHWEGCEDRTWDPKNQLQEIPAFNFPNSFPNLSENPSKLG